MSKALKRRRKNRKQLKTNRDFTEGRCRTGKVGECKNWNVKQEEGLTKKKGKSKGTKKEMRRKGILAR